MPREKKFLQRRDEVSRGRGARVKLLGVKMARERVNRVKCDWSIRIYPDPSRTGSTCTRAAVCDVNSGIHQLTFKTFRATSIITHTFRSERGCAQYLPIVSHLTLSTLSLYFNTPWTIRRDVSESRLGVVITVIDMSISLFEFRCSQV